MPLIWKQEEIKTVGNADSTISPYLKCWIKRGNTVVVGVIGEGTALDLQANWDSPFEQDSAGSFFERTGGLIQLATGQTSKTTLNSAQVWGGNRPLSATVSLLLYAKSNPKHEVEDAISELKRMASPEVNSSIPIADIKERSVKVGRIPSPVSVNIGRNFIWPNCIIENISEPLDSPRNAQGYRLDAMVNLTIQTSEMLNESDISRTSF